MVSDQPTVAEQLGYDRDARLLVIRVDDLGLCHSANRASFKALEEGVPTSGCAMAPCPWMPEVAEYAAKHPEIELGVHLTMTSFTSERDTYAFGPVAARDKVASLLDERGYFYHGMDDFLAGATDEAFELELRAQIERIIQMGLNPVHLSAHMGGGLRRRSFLEIYLRLAREYELLPGVTVDDGTDGHYDGPLFDSFTRWTPKFRPEPTPRERLYGAFRDLAPGLHLLVFHLGYDDEELRGIRNRFALERVCELDLALSDKTRDLLDELDITTIPMAPLRDLWLTK